MSLTLLEGALGAERCCQTPIVGSRSLPLSLYREDIWPCSGRLGGDSNHHESFTIILIHVSGHTFLAFRDADQVINLKLIPRNLGELGQTVRIHVL